MSAVMDRTRFLGASDSAAVLGLSPYHTPVDLWMLKTGRKVDAVDPVLERMRERGHRLEPFIREMTVQKLIDEGHDVELLATNHRYFDAEHPFLSCEIDFELLLDGEHINVDAKSVSSYARRKWGDVDSDAVPIEYAAQFMTGLMLTPPRQRCLVAALRSFDDVDLYWLQRDDDTIAGLRRKLVEFWVDHVVADVAPSPMVFDDVKALFPVDDGQVIEATEDIADATRELAEVKAYIKAYEKREAELQLRIGEYMSPRSRLTWQGSDLLTWKAQNDSRVDITELRAALPDVAARFTRTKVIRVMRACKPFKAKGR